LKVKSTSSASNGWPSENLMPRRSFNVNTVPSFETVQDLARAGSDFCVARLMWIKSPIMRPSTPREFWSTVRIGFSVRGSDRCAITSLPPRIPGSDVVRRRSSCAIACRPARSGKSAAYKKSKRLKRTKPGFLCWTRSLILSAPAMSLPMSDTPKIPGPAPVQARASTSTTRGRDIAAPVPACCPNWERARRFPAQEMTR